MQYYKHITIWIFLCVFLFVSCERVIDVDLNSASPKFVIEGSVTDNGQAHQVRITQTKNFDESNDFEGISSAEVTIADNAGNSSTLTYIGDGIYETTEIGGTPGNTYFLTVKVGGETFVAESTMPEPATFDSLYVEELSTFGTPVKITQTIFSDPAGVNNFYRHILFVNNVRAEPIYLGTDEGRDGQEIERPLPYLDGGNEEDWLKAGDSVTVEFQTIEEEVYDYYFSLNQTIEQDAATPANPVSNISGGALGYFSAHSVQTKTIEVD